MSGFGANIINEINHLPPYRVYGQVINIVGLMIEVGGVKGNLSIGDHCIIYARNDRRVTCEVIGFAGGNALVMPFSPLDGIGMGCRAEVGASQPVVFPTPAWLGRIVNGFGEPIDGKGPLPMGDHPYPIRINPPPSHERKRVSDVSTLGTH